MSDTIKSMQLYPHAARILKVLAAEGFEADAHLPIEVLSRHDQLHYHGTRAVDAAIGLAGIGKGARVLEIGAGWGGCARWIAAAAGAEVDAIELQEDYHDIGQQLTARSGLADRVRHIRADYLAHAAAPGAYDAAVSWLALFHIPARPEYLARTFMALRPGGRFVAEDLTALAPVSAGEDAEFRAHLFPNSLVDPETYLEDLRRAGFRVLASEDMTADWTAFTAERLVAFRTARAAHQATHGTEGAAALETFYDKMAGYFARGLVGGIRFVAVRP